MQHRPRACGPAARLFIRAATLVIRRSQFRSSRTPARSRGICPALPDYIREVVSALLPVIAFCAIFQLIFKRFHKIQLQKIGIGFLYTFVGLALFLTGVNVGFMPAGHYLGQQLALSGKSWILIPLGMLIGYFLVTAEPAVHVLNRQVETITNGGISQRAMMLSLSIGVACSVGLAMMRVLTGISIYYILIPGYLIALTLTFFVPKIFTGIAFDSGGVASGPMTTTFLLPFSMGACEALGGNRADRCLRHRGDGRHDAAADDTDARSALPLQTERYAAGYARCGR